MLRNILGKFSLLIVSLLLISCASQKSIPPFNAADVNPELNSGQPTQKVDNLITEKQIAVPPSQPVEVEKDVKPVKETGEALEQTPEFLKRNLYQKMFPLPWMYNLTPAKQTSNQSITMTLRELPTL